MQTLKEFKEDLSWSMLTDFLSGEELEGIYESVDEDSYVSFNDIEADFETTIIDVNLCSVLEDFSELLEEGHLDKIKIYYTKLDKMYVGVLYYSY